MLSSSGYVSISLVTHQEHCCVSQHTGFILWEVFQISMQNSCLEISLKTTNSNLLLEPGDHKSY